MDEAKAGQAGVASAQREDPDTAMAAAVRLAFVPRDHVDVEVTAGEPAGHHGLLPFDSAGMPGVDTRQLAERIVGDEADSGADSTHASLVAWWLQVACDANGDTSLRADVIAIAAANTTNALVHSFTSTTLWARARSAPYSKTLDSR